MFFQQMYEWMTSGVDINLSFRKQDDRLTVILLPKNNGLKDEQQQFFMPFTLSGTPQMLDNEFAAVISEPLKKACLLCNVKIPEKQPQNNKVAKEGKARYEQLFKKGEELEKQKKYKEALSCYEEAKDIAQPSNMKIIKDKIASMEAWTKQGNLFSLIETENPGKENQEPVQENPVETKQTPMPLKQLPGEEIHEDTPQNFMGNRLLPQECTMESFDNMDFPMILDNGEANSDFTSMSY